ncbi:hypothetical protein B0H13DRAFT_2683032 [Mycena leptocephala]|nr:hypothetical protein B0H13DRAFT_2683032 [Mycena leptocephala]
MHFVDANANTRRLFAHPSSILPPATHMTRTSALRPLVDSVAFARRPYYAPSRELALPRGSSSWTEEDGVHDCAQHPASLTSRSNDVGSFVDLNSNPNEDEVFPHESVLLTAWRRASAARQAREARLSGLTRAAAIPRPEPRDSARLSAASSASPRGSMRDAHRPGIRDSWQFLLADTELPQCRWVYTCYPYPLNSLHYIFEVFVRLHQYLDDVSDDAHANLDPEVTRKRSLKGDVPSRPSLQVLPCTEVADGSLEGYSCVNTLHGLPCTSLPALDPLRAVAGYCTLLVSAFLLVESERGLLRLDVPARPSRLIWCDTDAVPLLVARARASPWLLPP